MAISTAQKNKLNKACRANQDVSLGTLIQTIQSASATSYASFKMSGSVLVAAAQVTASLVEVATGLTGLTGHMVTAYNSGSAIGGSALKVLNSGSNLRVWCNSEGSSVVLDQKIYWMVW